VPVPSGLCASGTVAPGRLVVAGGTVVVVGAGGVVFAVVAGWFGNT
jgi:hypothetical protein